MPKADDLFRPTAVPDHPPEEDLTEAAAKPRKASSVHVVEQREPAEEGKPRRAKGKRAAETPEKTHSGRIKHEEKMTVYVTADELLDIETARLSLRRALGTSVDRGRLVRAAVAIALADLEAQGEDSQLVQRLMQA
jgi:hypothetical protein